MVGVIGIIIVLLIVGFFVWKDVKNQSKSIKQQGMAQKRYAVTIPLIIGIVTYIVLSVIVSNVLNDGYDIDAKISNDVSFCAVIAIVASWFIAKSNLDRLIYLAIIVIISAIAISNWRELSYGTAIITHLTNISVIVIAALKRNKPTLLSDSLIKYVDWLFRLFPIIILTFFAIVGLYNSINSVIKGRYISDIIMPGIAGVITLLLSFYLANRMCKKHIAMPQKSEQVFWWIVAAISFIIVISLLLLFM